MSNKSNNQGRAYEFACINILANEINRYRRVEIIANSSIIAAKNAWNTLDDHMIGILSLSAISMVDTLFDLEPLILEDNGDILTLELQTDEKGEEGDVRDILISRKDIQWVIGLSVKHNHFAVKHSRLAKNLDFSYKWFDIPCTQEYWDEIRDRFNWLEELKKQGIEWKDLESKEDDVYVPLLYAFMNEIERQYKINSALPKKMVEYLLGKYDFYKVISIDQRRTTQIQSYNLRGTLNNSGNTRVAEIIVPRVYLPTRIVQMDFKHNSKNTVELYMDNGWQFSFRIHNASTVIEPSLKFDIQIIGMPTTILTINCVWK